MKSCAPRHRRISPRPASCITIFLNLRPAGAQPSGEAAADLLVAAEHD